MRKVRDRVTELVRVRAGDLLENPANWRSHPKAQRAALRGLLKEIGYADALLARREGRRLVLIDGHLRRSIDADQVVPVLVLDVTEAEAEKLLLTLDPLAALATPDNEALAELLARVDTESAAVRELLEGLARDAGVSHRLLADPEAIPETPKTQPRSRPGDLWEMGAHRLACADATSKRAMEALAAGEQAQVLLTDPPYGVAYVGKTKARLRISGDEERGLAELLALAFARAGSVLEEGARLYVFHPAGPGSVLFAQAFAAQGWKIRQDLVWVKDSLVLGHSDYHYRHEPILYGTTASSKRMGRGGHGWYGSNGEDSVFEVARPPASREHPTAKPVELLRRLIANSSEEKDVVLDPFAGSGSMLAACEILGRRAFLVEIDPTYCDVILRRYEALTGNKPKRLRRKAA